MEALPVTYLDTHCAMWAYNAGWARFSRAGLERLEDDELRVSPIVLLELELLFEIKRLSVRPIEMLDRLAQDLGAKYCDTPFEDVALAATWMKFARDPVDRMLCAQALAGGGDLLTKDEYLLKHFPKAVW